MKFGNQYPEGIRPPTIERKLAKAGIFPEHFHRPRIQLPDFPQHSRTKNPPDYTLEIVDPEDTEDESTPPTVAQVIIPQS